MQAFTEKTVGSVWYFAGVCLPRNNTDTSPTQNRKKSEKDTNSTQDRHKTESFLFRFLSVMYRICVGLVSVSGDTR